MTLELSAADFDTLLSSLLERDEALIFKKDAGGHQKHDAEVDLYVFSGHLEALRSEEIDGEVWETLEDLEYTAESEDEAWERIKGFFLERGCVLLRVEADEFILSEVLARRLGLLG